MKRKKLYYIPGLICIIGLPILFFFMGPDDPDYKTCIKIFLLSDKKPIDGNIKFSKYGVYDLVKKKKLINVNLDGINYYDDIRELYVQNTKLLFIQREIERLQFTNDTSSVLKIEFGEDATYGQFIWLMNQTMLYQAKRFAVVDNEFYLFANPPPIHYDNSGLSIDASGLTFNIPPYQKPTKWEIFKREFYYKMEEIRIMAKRNYLLITGFLLFILIPSLIKIIRRKKNMIYVAVTA